ncbi:hypothetical protein KEM52_004731 [Ascosphaera acerosa]|nr:hypothetical protein KEM52_004731 [Ascosphaera acerosa]
MEEYLWMMTRVMPTSQMMHRSVKPPGLSQGSDRPRHGLVSDREKADRYILRSELLPPIGALLRIDLFREFGELLARDLNVQWQILVGSEDVWEVGR